MLIGTGHGVGRWVCEDHGVGSWKSGEFVSESEVSGCS